MTRVLTTFGFATAMSADISVDCDVRGRTTAVSGSADSAVSALAPDVELIRTFPTTPGMSLEARTQPANPVNVPGPTTTWERAEIETDTSLKTSPSSRYATRLTLASLPLAFVRISSVDVCVLFVTYGK